MASGITEVTTAIPISNSVLLGTHNTIFQSVTEYVSKRESLIEASLIGGGCLMKAGKEQKEDRCEPCYRT